MAVQANNVPVEMSKTKHAIRECVALFIWSYVVLKLLFFDFDIYILDRFAPRLRWVTDYKAFVLIAVIAISWILLGKKGFPRTALYIAAYPVVVIFWKFPRAAFRQWPVAIIAAPVIYRLITTLRTTFLLYTAAILCALTVLLSSDHTILAFAITTLVGFAIIHLMMSFRKAYGRGAFSRLAGLLTKLRESVDKGALDGTQPVTAGLSPPLATPRVLPVLYIIRRVADVVDQKVKAAGRSRRYDLCLIFGWLYTVALTCVTFAFAYTGIERIDPASFTSAKNADFWNFLGFSLGALLVHRPSCRTPS